MADDALVQEAVTALMARKLEVRSGYCEMDGRDVVQDALGNAYGWEDTLKSVTNHIASAVKNGDETDHCEIGRLIDGAVRRYARDGLTQIEIDAEVAAIQRQRADEAALERFAA